MARPASKGRLVSALRAALALVAASVVGLLPLRSPQVFRSRIDAVVVNVSVRDGKIPVKDLTIRDFELRDNGVIQSLSDASIETTPLDVTLAIDSSGSISTLQFEQLEKAIEQFAAKFDVADRCRIVTFRRQVHERLPLGPCPASLSLVREEPGVRVETALFDAAMLSLIDGPSEERRHAAILLTDGRENASFIDGRELLDVARYSETTVDIVLSSSAQAGPILSGSGHAQTLIRLAQTTGGQVIPLGTDGTVASAFLEALDSWHASYVLRYVPVGVDLHGWHQIAVTTKRPNRYDVHARAGYLRE
jgi:VWFA-related protein